MKFLEIKLETSVLHALISYRDVIRCKFDKVLALNEEIVDLLESEEEITSEVDKQFQFETFVNKNLLKIEDVVVKSKQICVKKKDSTVETHVKLPKIEITKFSGDPTEWQTFFDSFERSIHKSESLSPVEKMNYLINTE